MKIEITGESLKKLMPLWLWIGCWLSAYGATEAHNSFLFVLFSAHAIVLGLVAIAMFVDWD